jgi:hypothetical protein
MVVWKPIIIAAARKERVFFKLLDKLKPIILDKGQNIEGTLSMINLFVMHHAEKYNENG